MVLYAPEQLAQVDITWLFGIIGAAAVAIAGAVAWLLSREDRNLRDVLTSIDAIRDSVTMSTKLGQDTLETVKELTKNVSELAHRQSLMETVLAQLMRMQAKGCHTDGCPLASALLKQQEQLEDTHRTKKITGGTEDGR